MAKNDPSKELFRMMRAAGVRKRVAREVCAAVDSRHKTGKTPKALRQAARDFHTLATRLEDHAGAVPAKAKTTRQRRTPARPRTTTPRRQTRTRPNPAT